MIKSTDVFNPKRLDELAYGRTSATLREINMMGRLILRATPAEHSDDFHFDLFAACCKEKLATARNKGRSGWDNPEVCSVEHLAELLVHHLTKGNAGTFEDIANFAMMLHQRSADPKVLARAFRSQRFILTPGEKDAVERALNAIPPKPLERCAAGRDGECNHPDCPQLRDNEPAASGRHCPIDTWEEE